MKDGVKNSRLLFVDSDELQISNHAKARISLPNYPFQVCCDDTMRLTLLQFDIDKVWHDIHVANNRYYLYNPDAVSDGSDPFYEFVIPVGSYDSKAALSDAIQSSLEDGPFLPDGTTRVCGSAPTVAYDTDHDDPVWKFDITFPTGKFSSAFFCTFHVKDGAYPDMSSSSSLPNNNTIADSFAHYSDTHEILGIVPSKTVLPVESMTRSVTGSVTTFRGPFAFRLKTIQAVYIRSSINSGNYQSTGHNQNMPESNQMTETQIFAKVHSSGSRHLYWEDNNDTYQLNMQQKHLESLELWLTDSKGRLLTNIVGPNSTSALVFRCVIRWDHLAAIQHSKGHVASIDDLSGKVGQKCCPSL